MWTVFLANMRRAALSSQTQSGRPAALDPVGRTTARLGLLLRPSRSRRPCPEFTASVTRCTRATQCLPRATAGGTTRTRCTAACSTRTACSPTAAAIPSRDPSPRRWTNNTGCTPGWERQVRADAVSYVLFPSPRVNALTKHWETYIGG